MPQQLMCANGHSWEDSAPVPEKANTAALCPTCGEQCLWPEQLTTDDPHKTRLHQPATAPGAGASGPGPSGPGTWPDVPGYQLLEMLGRGGMGVVYKARQTGLKRLVALKMIIAGELAGPDLQARFLSEAEAVARLRHPNIVQIHEVGKAGGQPFFALEYVEGGSLARQLAVAPQPPRQAAELVRMLAHALQAAHAQGVIHRDLKPANVLLTSEGVPKVTDFGLAKQLDDESGQTQTGAIVGTPSYMAPEQAQGRAVTPAADVYALGAILYECLTGRPPLRGATLLETLDLVRTQEPVSPSQLQPKTPRDLETICLKCLHKDPAKRYAAAEQLADDLGRFLDGRPILARPVGRLERTYRWCRRNPLAATFLVTLLLATAGAIALTVWALGERDRASDNAKKEANERQRADLAADAAWTNQYIAHMRLMESDWDGRNLSRILDTLDIYRKPPPGRKDVRHWEWYHQERLSNPELHTLIGHKGLVYAVAFSPDGTRLASASMDQTVKLWDVASGRELRVLKGHTSAVLGVAFSPDGTRLASASQDDTVKLWDAATGQELRTLKSQYQYHLKVELAFSPDGQRLASGIPGSTRGTTRLWEVASGRELLSLKEGSAMAFSPDGRQLASDGKDNTLKLWDAATGQELRSFKGRAIEGQFGQVLSVAFSPDGRQLASAGADTVKLWDTASCQELRTLKGHVGLVRIVAFSPDGQRLASASDDLTMKLWDAATGQELRTFQGHLGYLTSVAFSPDGLWLATASNDQTVKLWRATATDHGLRNLKHRGNLTSVAFSPDGKRLASASHEGTVKLWDPASGQELRTIKGHSDVVRNVVFSPDGQWLASSSEDRTVKLWEAANGKDLSTLKGHTHWVNDVAFSPDGMLLASASEDSTVKLWDRASGQEIRTLKGHGGAVWSVVFISPDGQRLASSSEDRTLKVWDAASGQELHTLKDDTSFPFRLAVSPDGQRLAVSSSDLTVKLWDLKDQTGGDIGPPMMSLKDPKGFSTVAFSPDGKRLVSVSGPQTVKLWDVATGQELRTLKVHSPDIQTVAYSRDGRLATASFDATVRLWDGRPPTPEVNAEIEAIRLLEVLFAKPLSRSEVRAALQRDPIISDAIRRQALDLAERFQEETDPIKYHAAAWPVIRHPHSNVFMCQFAVAQMNTACNLRPDINGYRSALGAAQYRLGKFQKERYPEALATLTQGDWWDLEKLAFLAMTHHQLGAKEQARATLARLRQVMKQALEVARPEVQTLLPFLHEAAELIEGKPAPPR